MQLQRLITWLPCKDSSRDYRAKTHHVITVQRLITWLLCKDSSRDYCAKTHHVITVPSLIIWLPIYQVALLTAQVLRFEKRKVDSQHINTSRGSTHVECRHWSMVSTSRVPTMVECQHIDFRHSSSQHHDIKGFGLRLTSARRDLRCSSALRSSMFAVSVSG